MVQETLQLRDQIEPNL